MSGKLKLVLLVITTTVFSAQVAQCASYDVDAVQQVERAFQAACAAQTAQAVQEDVSPDLPRKKIQIRHRNKLCTWQGCNKKFKMVSHLKNHLRSHNGEQPFACDQCSESFSQNSHLTRHKTIHTKAAQVICDCGASLARADYMAKHISSLKHRNLMNQKQWGIEGARALKQFEKAKRRNAQLAQAVAQQDDDYEPSAKRQRVEEEELL